jgi:hypothetical protein
MDPGFWRQERRKVRLTMDAPLTASCQALPVPSSDIDD